jgi:putative transposase
MPARKEEFSPGAIFHVYNRGVARQRVFYSVDECGLFLSLMREKLLPIADVLSYCLIPNHYHLTLRLKQDDLSDGMQRFMTAFVKRVNAAHDRPGPLFQGRFNAIPVTSDRQLLYLTCYHHLNPLAAGLVRSARDWQLSSYPDYLGMRAGSLVCMDPVLELAGGRDAYEKFVEEYALLKYGMPICNDGAPPMHAHMPYFTS